MDERGQTYYYVRDGSKSQWNLPAAPGRSMVENGMEADGTSVIKNWRHTMGPVPLSSGHDDGVRLSHTRTHSDLHVQVTSRVQGVAAG